MCPGEILIHVTISRVPHAYMVSQTLMKSANFQKASDPQKIAKILCEDFVKVVWSESCTEEPSILKATYLESLYV